MDSIYAMLMTFVMQVRFKIESFFKKEDGAVDIIAIVVLIGIAIVVALVFKDRIAELVRTLFDQIDNNAQNAIANGNN